MKELALFVGEVLHLKIANPVFFELILDAQEDALLLWVEFVATLIDGIELLFRRHERFVVADLLLDEREVGQAADAHHEELLEVAREDGDERKTLEQRNVAVFALIEYALIEREPRKLAILHIRKALKALLVR